MGSPDVNFPEPTPEERALQAEQLEVLQESRAIASEQSRIQSLLLPFVLEESGLTPQLDAEGNITSFARQTDPNQTLRQNIETAFLERTQAALAGDLPVNPALTRELAEQEGTLRDQLRRRFGPDFETSSPAIETLDRFDRSRQELLEGARRGDLTLAEQLGLAREQQRLASENDFLNRLGFSGNFQSSSIGSLLGVGQGFNAPLQRGLAERQGQFQAASVNAQAQASTLGALFGGLGTLGGFALAGPLGGQIFGPGPPTGGGGGFTVGGALPFA